MPCTTDRTRIADFDSKIPTWNVRGRLLTPKERELVAKKMGLCPTPGCEMKTHDVKLFLRKPRTNDWVYKGICLPCTLSSTKSRFYKMIPVPVIQKFRSLPKYPRSPLKQGNVTIKDNPEEQTGRGRRRQQRGGRIAPLLRAPSPSPPPQPPIPSRRSEGNIIGNESSQSLYEGESIRNIMETAIKEQNTSTGARQSHRRPLGKEYYQHNDDSITTSASSTCALYPGMPPEYLPMPTLHKAAFKPIITVLRKKNGTTTTDATNTGATAVKEVLSYETEEVFLVRNSTESTNQAYRRLHNKPSVKLGGDDGSMGEIFFCITLPKHTFFCNQEFNYIKDEDNDDGIVFDEPDPSKNNYQLVAIKKWNRSVIDKHIKDGGPINPYHEVAIMEQYGNRYQDNTDVMMKIPSCIEALVDSQYLYVVWPYCEYSQSLKNSLIFQTVSSSTSDNNNSIMSCERQTGVYDKNTNMVKSMFSRIVDIMKSMQQLKLCHRSLSDETIAEAYGFCTLQDLCTCIQVPHVKEDWQKQQQKQYFMIQPLGPCGKFSFMAPEIYLGTKDFDGYAVDVWSLGCLLFALLTGRHLFARPSIGDRFFTEFILMGNLSKDESLKTMVDYLLEERHGGTKDEEYLLLYKAVHDLDPQVRHLLQGMLQQDPTKRMTLDQIASHEWLSGTTNCY